MTRITTRKKALLLSFFLTFIYFLFHQIFVIQRLSQLQYGFLIYPLVTSFLMFIGLYWVLNFKIKGERILTILLFAAVTIFIAALFFESLILNQSKLEQLTTSFGFTIIVFLVNYIVILTMNIVNYSFLNDIPLGQAGRASSYLLSLVTQYLAFFSLFSNPSSILFKEILVFVITFFYSYCLLWGLKIKRRHIYLSSLSIALIATLLSIILNIWPTTTEIVSLILTLVLYICLGVALEMRSKVAKLLWIEYSGLIIFIFIVLLLTSPWGINGHLI